MHRRNYGRRSGVIVDSCTEHGLWFDASELDDLLRWVRRGGEAAATRRQAEESDQLERQRRFQRDMGPQVGDLGPPSDDGWLPIALEAVLRWFLS